MPPISTRLQSTASAEDVRPDAINADQSSFNGGGCDVGAMQ